MTIDRRAGTVMAILLGLAILVNVDRFVFGADAHLRAHDFADNTITGLGSCGDFWRSALQSTWDPTQLRGWPRAGSSMHAELLLCVVAGIVPLAAVGPIFHVLVLSVMAVGGFLFVHAFLRRSHEAAIAGSLLNITLYYFFHEHPLIPSAILLPSLLGFLALKGPGLRERVVMFAGAALIIGLSNPPATLVLMPLGHLALIFIAPRTYRRAYLLRWIIFWAIYGVYYGPMMVALLREFSESSRSLYRPGAVTEPFLQIFKGRLLNPAVISPAAVLLALTGRRTWRVSVLVLIGVIGFVGLSAANEMVVGKVGPRFPLLISLSSMYYRMYYFVPVAMVIWAAWWFDRTRADSRETRVRYAVVAAAFCAAVAWGIGTTPHVFRPYWKYAAVIAAMGITVPWWTRTTLRVTAVAALVIVFGRYQFTSIYEVPHQGNLFVEPAGLGQPHEGFRAVTVMSDCDSVSVFPAQARAAGVDTLDGIANNYSRGYVERWAHFVAGTPPSCTSRYAGWPTRAELTVPDFRGRSDRVTAWLWINNVAFVRSAAPLSHPRLTLVDTRDFFIDGLSDVPRYLYRLENPVARLFTIPAAIAADASSGNLAIEERALEILQRTSATANVPAELVNGSHIRFTGAFDDTAAVVANLNFHRGWTLLVDGAESARPAPGPFGMIRVPTVAGTHDYELVFRSPFTPFVPLGMALAVALLWASTRWSGRFLDLGGSTGHNSSRSRREQSTTSQPLSISSGISL